MDIKLYVAIAICPSKPLTLIGNPCFLLNITVKISWNANFKSTLRQNKQIQEISFVF